MFLHYIQVVPRFWNSLWLESQERRLAPLLHFFRFLHHHFLGESSWCIRITVGLGLALLTTSNKLASQLELQPSPADLMKSDRCLSIHILSTLVRYPISSYHRVSNLKYTDNTHTRWLSQKISHNKSESLLFGFRRIRIKLIAAILRMREKLHPFLCKRG